MKNKTVEEQAKEFRKTTANQMYGDELGFLAGFRAKQKDTDKIILDSLNKLRSNLADEEKVKLTKVISQDKIELLKAQINVLLEIQNKIGGRHTSQNKKNKLK